MRRVPILGLFLALVAAAVLTGCRHAPVTGRRQLLLFSDAHETQLGVQAFAEVLKESKLSGDARAAAIVERVGQRIAAVSGMQDRAWEFKLIESAEPNAFALPGGKVAVYTGILPVCLNEAGLAAVVGHEVAHVMARHAGERMSGDLLVNLALTGAEISLGGQKPAVRQGIMAALGLGAQVGVSLPYSRSHEREADRIGIQLMAQAGYDPSEAPRVWERMARLGGGSPPQFLSTHPASSERRKALQALLPKMRRFYAAAAVQHGLGESFAPPQ